MNKKGNKIILVVLMSLVFLCLPVWAGDEKKPDLESLVEIMEAPKAELATSRFGIGLRLSGGLNFLQRRRHQRHQGRASRSTNTRPAWPACPTRSTRATSTAPSKERPTCCSTSGNGSEFRWVHLTWEEKAITELSSICPLAPGRPIPSPSIRPSRLFRSPSACSSPAPGQALRPAGRGRRRLDLRPARHRPEVHRQSGFHALQLRGQGRRPVLLRPVGAGGQHRARLLLFRGGPGADRKNPRLHRQLTKYFQNDILVYSGSGGFYTYDQNVSGHPVRFIDFASQPPSGASVSNVSETQVDFSGVSARGGFRIRF